MIHFILICCMFLTINYIGASANPSWLTETEKDKTVKELHKTQDERDMYRTFTQVLAPALVIKTAYHAILSQDQQKSSTCAKVAIGLSAATTLYLVGRSYVLADDKKK